MRGRATAAVVVVVVVVLAASMVVSGSPAAPQTEPDPDPGADAAVAVLDDVAEAVVPDVELVEARTRFSKSYTTETPGVMRAEVSAVPVHYPDGDGWAEIDTTLVPAGDGGLEVAANAFELRIAPTADAAELVRFEPAGGGSVSWRLDGATPGVPVEADEATVVFDDAQAGVDVELTSTPVGVKETLILESAAAPRSFRFPLTLDGLTAAIDDTGGVVDSDPDGEVVAEIPPGWAIDSSGQATTELAPPGTVTYTLEPDTTGVTLVVSVDDAWLTDPTRVYPVRIDPTVTVPSAAGSGDFDDTYTYFTQAGANNSEITNIKVGNPGLVAARGFVWFDLAAVAPEGPGEDHVRVLTAEVALHMIQGDCADGTPQVRQVTQHWIDGSTDRTDYWPGPSTATDPLDVDVTCNGSTVTVASTTPLDGSLAGLVDHWMADDTPHNFGIELRAADEGDTDHYKRFTSTEGAGANTPAPKLTLVYDYQPEHLWRDGDDADGDRDPTDDDPVTYTSYTGTENCYTEDEQDPPIGAAPPTGTACRVDLYNAGGAPTDGQAAVVLVHGGGYAAQYTADGAGRRRGQNTMMYADALAEAGYLVAVIDYRQGLFDEYRTAWPNDNPLIQYRNWFHCTQRFEQDGSTPKEWPPPASWTPDPNEPALPTECDAQAVDWIDFTDDAFAANEAAVADIQAAVAWLRSDPDHAVFDEQSADELGNVFVAGVSAGGFATLSAAYDPSPPSGAELDGAVAMAATHPLDGDLLDDRDLPDPVPPVQIQTSEYDFTSTLTGVSSDSHHAGNYDFARVLAGYVRDGDTTHANTPADVDLRVRCGELHTEGNTSTYMMYERIGQTIAFFDTIDASGTPFDNMWFGIEASSAFNQRIGADLVDNVGGGYIPLVGDFNGDGFDDIYWLGSGVGCDSLWFNQPDAANGPTGTFARVDKSDIVVDGAKNDPLDNPDEQLNPTAVRVGDFDGDGSDDLFFYKAGAASGTAGVDAVWTGSIDDPNPDDLATTATLTRTRFDDADDIDGTYEATVVGDYDGDGYDDLFFYDSAGNDLVWFGGAEEGEEGEEVLAFDKQVIGDGTPTDEAGLDGDHTVVAPDYNGDGYDDLLFADSADTRIWYGTATGFGTANTGGHTLTNSALPANTDIIVGQFGQFADHPDYVDCEDLFLYNTDTGTTDKIWYGRRTAGTHKPMNEDGLDIDAQLVPGDFNGDGLTDIIFRNDNLSGTDYLYTARPHYDPWPNRRGFDQTSLGDTIPHTRLGIPGQYGDPGTTSEPAATDILWHDTTNPTTTTTGWGWCAVFGCPP